MSDDDRPDSAAPDPGRSQRCGGRAGRSAPPAVPSDLVAPLAICSAVCAGLTAVLALRFAGRSEAEAGSVDSHAAGAVGLLLPDPGLGVWLFSRLGSPPVVAGLAVLVAVACLARGLRRMAVLAAAGPLLTGIVSTALKPLVGRTITGYPPVPSLAFPSGHTAGATALTLVTVLALVQVVRTGRRVGLLLTLGAPTAVGAAMAVALVSMNIHYPSDTVGGFLVAMTTVIGAALLLDRACDRIPARR